MWVFASQKYIGIGLQEPQYKHCPGGMNTRPGSWLVFKPKAHSDLPTNFRTEGHQQTIQRVLEDRLLSCETSI